MEDLKGEETCHLQGKISAKMKVNTRIQKTQDKIIEKRN